MTAGLLADRARPMAAVVDLVGMDVQANPGRAER